MSVPAWMKAPKTSGDMAEAQTPTTPVGAQPTKKVHSKPAPPWPKAKSTSDMLALAKGLIGRLRVISAAEGDDAALAIVQLESFVKATTDHEAHGRNWWARYGDKLGHQLAAIFPKLLPDYVPVEGDAAVQAVLQAFPGASLEPPFDYAASYAEIARWNASVERDRLAAEARAEGRGARKSNETPGGGLL